jgi:hypothetical protein
MSAFMRSSVLILLAVLASCVEGSELPPTPEEAPEHAVLVYFDDYGGGDLSRLFALEKRLEEAVAAAKVGVLDGNEIAVDGSDGTLYLYGPDGDKLFAAIRPILEATDFTRTARVVVRYGPPEDGVREQEVVLGR